MLCPSLRLLLYKENMTQQKELTLVTCLSTASSALFIARKIARMDDKLSISSFLVLSLRSWKIMLGDKIATACIEIKKWYSSFIKEYNLFHMNTYAIKIANTKTAI
jgi:hypothetical protein